MANRSVILTIGMRARRSKREAEEAYQESYTRGMWDARTGVFKPAAASSAPGYRAGRKAERGRTSPYQPEFGPHFERKTNWSW